MAGKMLKRITAIALIAIMCIGVIPMHAAESQSDPEGDAVLEEAAMAEEAAAPAAPTEGDWAELPVVEVPAAEEPAAEEPAVEEPAAEPAVEPAAEEPAAEEPAAEPAVEEPAAEEPAAEEPAAEEPAVEEPAAEEPAVEEPAAEEPAVEEPAAEEPAAEKPVATEIPVEESIEPQIMVKEPAAEIPVIEEKGITEPEADATTMDAPETKAQALEPDAEKTRSETKGTPSVDDLPFIELDQTTNVTVTDEDPEAYFRFTPATSGRYVFYSISNIDTFGSLYNSEFQLLKDNDDGGEDHNFMLSYELTAGTTYIFGARLYSGGAESFDVILEHGKKITSFSVEPINSEILEHTHGYWREDPLGREDFYYYDIDYWHPDIPSGNLIYTVTYNDETYTGDRDYLYKIFGEEPSLDDFVQELNHWTAGNTYTVNATFMDMSYAFEITIQSSPVTSFSVAPVQIIEYTHGSYVPAEEEIFIYDLDAWDSETQSYLLEYTVVYDGITYTGDRQEIYQAIGEFPIADGSSQYTTQWTLGGTYKATASLMGKTCEFDVTIISNPFTYFSVEPASPIEIIENTYGYWTTDYDGTDFYYYNDFDQWNYDTQSYNLIYTIVYDGETYTGDRETIYKTFGLLPNTSAYDQSENHWTVDQTYQVTVTFRGMTSELNVKIISNPLTWFSVEPAAPVEIMENTHGQWQIDSFGEDYYYYYDFDVWNSDIQNNNLIYTIVYDGETITGNSDTIFEAVREWPSVYGGNQSENHWTVDGTYTATASLLGKTCEFDVTIVSNPLTWFSVEPVVPIEIVEHTHGQWETDASGTEYYYYNDFDYWHNDTQRYNLIYTVVYDGETITGNRQTIYEATGEWPTEYGNDQYENHWTVDGTYTATAEFMGMTCEFEVTIVPSPLTSFSVTSGSPVEIIENTQGLWDTDENGTKYYYYMGIEQWDSNTLSYNLTYTVVYDGETYTGDRDDIYEALGEYPSVYGENQYDNHWTVGGTYTATAEFMGMTCDFDVKIVPSPLTSFSITGGVPVEFIENTHGSWRTDYSSGEQYYYYAFDIYGGNASIIDNIIYTVVYNGETYTGNSTAIYRAIGERPSITGEGQDSNHWVVGQTYQATATLMDKTCQFDVKIVPNPVTSISVEPIEIIEYTHGGWTGAFIDGTYVSEAYYRYSDFDFYDDETGYSLIYTVVYNGETYTGDRNEISRIVGEMPSYSYGNQSYSNPWEAGNTYKATASLMGQTCEFDVTIVSSPLTSFMVAPVDIIEGTYCTYIDAASGSPWTYYDVNGMPLQYTVVKDGQTFTGTAKELYSRYGYSVSLKMSMSAQNENHWEKDNTYYVDVWFIGAHTQVQINILPSPVTSFVVNDAEIVENTNGYTSYDSDGEFFYYNVLSADVRCEVTYDGTFSGTLSELSTRYEHSSASIVTNQSSEHWVKDGTYEATAYFMGKTCTFQVTIVEDETEWEIIDGVLYIYEKADMQNWSLKAVPWYAQRAEITKVVIEDGVTRIGSNAFNGCTNLTEVNIPDSVTAIGESAFSGCTSLAEINIPESVTSMGMSSFAGCSALRTVTIPKTVTSVAYYGFRNCTNLSSVTLPKSVKQIGNAAFGNTSLSDVYYEGSESDRDEITIYDSTILTAQWHYGSGEEGLTGFSVKVPVEIIEHTHGSEAPGGYYNYSLDGWDNETQSYLLEYTVVYNGTTYIGDRDAIYRAVGAYPTVTDTQSATHWTVGNTYKATASLMGMTCEFDVKIVPGETDPLTSFSVVSPDLVKIIENTNGYWKTDYSSGEQYYYYAFDVYGGDYVVTDSIIYTIVYNGETYTGNSEAIYKVVGERPSIVGNGQESNHWTAGKNYQATATLMGMTCQFDVRIVSTSLSVTPVAPIEILENTHGQWDTDGSGTQYYSYTDIDYWDDDAQRYQLLYTVGYDGETYVGDRDAIYEVFGEAPTVWTLGQYSKHWIAGETYTTTVRFLGKSCGIEVKIIPDNILTRGTCGDDLTWELSKDGVLTISGTGEMSNWGAYDPAPWQEWYENIETVIIESGATSIGNYAFNGCSSLTSITIPDSVTSMGNRAFKDCSSLTSVTIPDSVTSIGPGIFYDCSSLTSITIPNRLRYIDNDTFYGCSSLTSVTIPDSVTGIGQSVFHNCSSLSSITIPDSVTSIGYYAFANCISLTSITIPDSVTSMGWWVFYGCSSLTSVTIPDSVTSIDKGVFYNCSSLTSITIPDSVTSIGAEAFYGCSSLTSVTIPDGVTSISGYTFNGCSSLTSVTIPDSVTSIGKNAFNDCNSLTAVYYAGTTAEWKAIAIDETGNDPLKTATIHCSDGDIVPVQTGWQVIDGKTYYYKEDGTRATEWLNVDGAWYYMGTDGAMVSDGIKKIESNWFYFNTEGKLQFGFQKVGSNWFYFNDYGCMLFGFQKIGDNWFYFNDYGCMLFGFQKIGDNWFYFDDYGCMKFGIQKIGSNWFYFDDYGCMKFGIQKIGSNYFYFDDYGCMKFGIQKIGSNYFYFDDYGCMKFGIQKIGSNYFYFDDYGCMKFGIQKIGSNYFYFDDYGCMKFGVQKIGSDYFYFDDYGCMTFGWKQIGTKWYYFDDYGRMLFGWQQIGGTRYYFDAYGALQS